MKTTWLSWNEIYCLNRLWMQPWEVVIWNSVYSRWFIWQITSGVKTFIWWEIHNLTETIESGRRSALKKMEEEVKRLNWFGIVWISNDVVFHDSNIEYISIWSIITNNTNSATKIFAASNAQELYCQVDSGYMPVNYVFGNVAYSLWVWRSIIWNLKSLVRWEIKEYSDIFNHTRHLALERIVQDAKDNKANAVVGIKTSIMPMFGTVEMLMTWTASYNKNLTPYTKDIITSDLPGPELWNLTKLWYIPLKLVLGTSVYSLWFIWWITSFFKSFIKWEIKELTDMIYWAREHALEIINKEAESIWADKVVWTQIYVYQLWWGLIEVMAIWTAVKKVENINTQSENLLLQAAIMDENTFTDMTYDRSNVWVTARWQSNNFWTNPSIVIFFVRLIRFIIIIAVLTSLFQRW